MKSIVGKLIGFALLAGIVFGLFLVVVVPIEMSKKAEAEKWPSRKGVITSSHARHHRGSVGRMPAGPYWKPEICGSYSDSTEKFCVSRVRFGGIRIGDGRASADETVARYPVGRTVDVYHSPGNPKETVLEAHSPWNEMFMLLGLGIALLVLPLLLWVFRRKIEPQRYGDA